MSLLVFPVMNDKLSTKRSNLKTPSKWKKSNEKFFTSHTVLKFCAKHQQSTITKYFLINIDNKRVNNYIFVECYQGNFAFLGLENYNLSSFRCERKSRRLQHRQFKIGTSSQQILPLRKYPGSTKQQ